MDIVIPSMIDPGMAPPGKHVMSIFVQYAPYDVNGGWNDAKREAFGDTVIKTLSRYAPNIESLILGTAGASRRPTSSASPGSPRATSSRASSRCTSCSSCGRSPQWAKYRTPIRGYWQCGVGHASGRRHHGRERPLAALEILKAGTSA